jgi:hypothetical protein
MRARRRFLLTGFGVTVVVFVAAMLRIPSGGGTSEAAHSLQPVKTMDLSPFSAQPPKTPLRLLFIHHSVGGALLADPGPEQATGDCIWKSHPNGGGARSLLSQSGYEVHEASYGSELGEATDRFDWVPKFRDKMDKVLACDLNDRRLPDGQRNQIVVFKSCFPNNELVGEGTAPGNANGPEMTVWNAKATMNALRDVLEKRPDVLFVYVTTPPLAQGSQSEPAWKWLAKELLRKPHAAEKLEKAGPLAREINNWIVAEDGWLAGYKGKNIVVFDYYDILTDHGASNFLRYPTGNGTNSHPSRAGNERAAAELVSFVNRAVRRSGLSD